ncbi:MAG TPA: hypothetical protein VMU90_10805 [Solirubrobacteraceae bacterium]|nr:hypothetical protein [Solirubrobacteraceae bacterium]
MSAHTVPTATIVAQRLAERAFRAAALVAQFDAEQTAGVEPSVRALQSFRWQPAESEHEAVAELVIAGAAGVHHVHVHAARLSADPERWQVDAACDCPDAWGHTWCGSCKHELAARALVSKALAAGCRPKPPAAAVALADPSSTEFRRLQAAQRGPALVGAAAERAAERADAERRGGLAFPINWPEAA